MGFLAWPMTEALLKILLTIKKKNTSQLSNKCNFDSLKWNSVSKKIYAFCKGTTNSPNLCMYVNPNDNDNEVNL